MSEGQNKPRRLVVVAPGFMGHLNSNRWTGFRQRLSREPGYGPNEAQWLSLNHGSSYMSWGGMHSLAKRLRATVDAEWIRSGGFEEVVLAGHSMGGPLIREIYLLASGAVPGESKSDWPDRVGRIVLLASVNRGIDPQRVVWLRPLAWLGRNFPLIAGYRALDLYRGSSFLTNLRINWIRHFGALAEATRLHADQRDDRARPVPCVVQLLGTSDGLVSPDDSEDVLALGRGKNLIVPDANHRDLFDCAAASDPELRWAVLRSAFCDDFHAEPTSPSDAIKDVRRVVFLLHGIRASNVDDWIRGLERAVLARDPFHTVVRHPTYGYFSAARFALPSVRRRNIRVFQDWYTEVLAEYPTAEFVIVAHSNGTYILGQSLRATPGMRFEQIVLAGSVLPRDFWQRFGNELRERVGRIRNDRADRDWPVALLCGALRGLLQRDVGTAGFAGFDGDMAHEVAYYRGGHGEALKPQFHASMVNFLFGEDAAAPDDLGTSPGFFRQLSNAAPYLAVLLAVGLVVGVGWFVLGSPWPDGWTMASRGLLAAIGLGGFYVALEIA